VGFASAGPDGSGATTGGDIGVVGTTGGGEKTGGVEPEGTTASEGVVANRVEAVSGALLRVEDWVALKPTVSDAPGAKADPQSVPVSVYP
jgi:hypothetical protein